MTVPIILITLGGLLLLNNLAPERFEFGRMWPVILIVIGLVKIVEYFGREDAVRNQHGGRRHVPTASRVNDPVRSEAAGEVDDNQTEEPR